jgi:GT2 family glycosyltransferase
VKVVVIIVTYNGAGWIEKCLNSLRNSSLNTDVIVIDNASTDETVSLIENLYPEVELVKRANNLGFGQANNIGLRMALDQNADFVFLLNQDAWIDQDTIGKLVEVSKRNPEYGIVSPFHLNYDGSAIEKYFNDWVLAHYTPDLLTDKMGNKLKQIYSTTFVHAACWLLPIDTIHLIGGFDPLFFHYGEDNDYVQRLLFKKKLVGISPNTNVHHKGENEGLKDAKKNLNFLMIQIVMQLKNPYASSFGALTLFFKQFTQALITSRKNKISYLAYKANFLRLIKILKSRKIQRNHLAYLK